MEIGEWVKRGGHIRFCAFACVFSVKYPPLDANVINAKKITLWATPLGVERSSHIWYPSCKRNPALRAIKNSHVKDEFAKIGFFNYFGTK